MNGQSITITRNEDGTFMVEAQGAEQPVALQSLDEVLAMVRDELGEGAEPAETWEQEAAARDDQGYRKPGGPMQSLA
jgi:hypothetical protein